MQIKLKSLYRQSQGMLSLLLHTLASLRQPRPMVLLALLLVVGSIWVFIELADEVRENSTEHFDTWAVRVLRQPGHPELPRGPAWLAEVGRDITALGSRAVLLLIVTTVVGYLYLRRAYATMWLVLFVTLSGGVLNRLLKWYFARARPDFVPVAGTMSPSFPSAHSMHAAIIYLSLGVLLMQLESSHAIKTYIFGVALILTFLVGVSRIYLGVHYPTDVLAGWAVGLAWALGCWLVAQYIQHRRRQKM
jgi:undecaprenyl-diphosphatase